MTAYRDQYARLFHGGRDVVLLGITNDPQEELFTWLRDADFPFLFASDSEHPGETYASFGGALRPSLNIQNRSVIVVDPEGRISGVIPEFNQVDPAAYEALGEMIDAVTPEPEDG